MKKFVFKKIVAGAMAAAISLSTGVTAFAADQQQITPGNTGSTTVKATVESEAVVWLPTNITLSGAPDENKKYTGEGAVIVEGDIAGNEFVSVTPESSISLKQSGKDDIIAQVTQEKTTFTYDDLQNSNSAVTSISADTLSAGEWNSVLHYNVSLDENPLPAGYTTLYEYDLSATEADDVKAYYMVPNKNTSPIEVETQASKATSRAAVGSAETKENNVVEYNGIRYVLSDEDELVISGEGEMKENIQADLVDYIGIYNDTLNHFSDVATSGRNQFYDGEWKYRVDDPSKEYAFCFDYNLVLNTVYPQSIVRNTGVVDGNYSGFYLINFELVNKDDPFYKEVMDYVDSIIPKYTVSMPTTVIVDEGVTNISNKAFSQCKSLENITLPNSIESIGNNAFYKCNSLSSIEFPDNLRSIGDFAFYETSISDIDIPDSVGNIGHSAFGNCQYLDNISIPKTISLGDSAFACLSNSNEERNIYYRGSLNDYMYEEWGLNIFRYGNIWNTNVNIYCNNELIPDSITLPDGLTKIKDHAFYGLSNVIEITIPNSITYIGGYAFAKTNIANLTLPSSLQEIGNNAFTSSNIESIHIPNSVTKIGDSAFSNNNKLKEVYLPYSILEIGKMAFVGMPKNSIIYCQLDDVADLLIGEGEHQNYMPDYTSIKVDSSMFS